jgi:hypothetical protein
MILPNHFRESFRAQTIRQRARRTLVQSSGFKQIAHTRA